jgi:hypothetical protein
MSDVSDQWMLSTRGASSGRPANRRILTGIHPNLTPGSMVRSQKHWHCLHRNVTPGFEDALDSM